MSHANVNSAAISPLAAYVCTDQGADLARAVVVLTSGSQAVIHGGGLGGAARICTGVPIAKTILTEMGNMSLDDACESVTELSRTGANVVVLGDRSDLGTYRALRNAGALEYFAFPVSPEEIVAANSQAAPQIQEVVQASFLTPALKLGKCVGVMGCNGGVGTSLLAQSLAFYAAATKGPALHTALIDADLRFGSQAIDLDRKDTPGLQEALSSPERIDKTFLGATMERLNDRLALYSQQAHTTQNIETLDAAFPQLIQSMKSNFDAVIVDLPRAVLIQQPALADVLDTLVLVLPAGYSGVNVASRMIAFLKTNAPNLTILPVLSEFRQDAKLTTNDVAKAIGQDVAVVMPKNEAALRKAHRAAKPVIETQPRNPYAKATRVLWEMASSRAVAEQETASSKKSRGFFRRTST